VEKQPRGAVQPDEPGREVSDQRLLAHGGSAEARSAPLENRGQVSHEPTVRVLLAESRPNYSVQVTAYSLRSASRRA
jgi:hypothetical protein